MADTPEPDASLGPMRATTAERVGGSVVLTWIAFYLIAFFLLLFTMPVTSHSNNWTGILPAFGILMFGAYRLARGGASVSTAFLYGCSTSLLFLFRLLTMGRFRLWIEYQAMSTAGIVITWIAICLFLGAAAAIVAHCVHDQANFGNAASNEPTQQN